MWYHIDCVYPTGLSTEHVKLLTKWLCVKCMASNFNSNYATDLPTRDELRQIVREEFTIFKEDLVSVTKSVQNDVQSYYADVVKSGQKEVTEAATVPAFVKNVCQSLNVEQLERKKKRKNVVVINVPEADPTLTCDQKREDYFGYLCSNYLKMVRENIATCFRARRVCRDLL